MQRRRLPGSEKISSSYLKIAIVIFTAWVILIFYLAFQSFEEQDLRPFMESIISEEALQELLPRVEFPYAGGRLTYREPYILIQFIVRKAAHLFFYAGLAFLVVYQQLLMGENAIKAFSKALIIVILVASVDEAIQYLHDNRAGLVEDVVLNISGSIFALLWLAWRERGGFIVKKSV